MKQTHAAKLLAIIFSLTLLSGCGGTPESTSESGDTEAKITERAELSVISESFEESCGNLRGSTYDNLNFRNTVFKAPQADHACTLTMTPLSGESPDEIYEFFSNAADFLTDGKYTGEEKKNEIRFVDGNYSVENGLAYPYNHPGIDDYKNGLETEYPWVTIDNEDYFIDMMFGVLRGYDSGALIDYDNSGHHRRSMYFMLNNNPSHRAVSYTEDLTCTDVYRLTDGEISIAQAAEFAQNYLDSLDITPYEGDIPTPKIVAVNVVDIGGGCYGFNFVTTVEYGGVLFDYRNTKGNDLGVTLIETDYDKQGYNSAAGSIDMIATNKIHHFLGIGRGYEITESEPQTSVITPEYAARIISEFFSGTMNFAVNEVSMVWLQTKTENEAAVETAYPCWKFKMNTGREIYHAFVNMLTGEIYLYVQAD